MLNLFESSWDRISQDVIVVMLELDETRYLHFLESRG